MKLFNKNPGDELHSEHKSVIAITKRDIAVPFGYEAPTSFFEVQKATAKIKEQQEREARIDNQGVGVKARFNRDQAAKILDNTAALLQCKDSYS